jgi:hypothetical protein
VNDFERAVIEAALSWQDSPEAMRAEGFFAPLSSAVDALRVHRAQLDAAGVEELPWHRVAVGDELRSKRGTFFPVIRVKREWEMGQSTGKHLITVDINGTAKQITRPTPAEPMAVVRRGDDGKAVDLFVNVFESE